MIIFAITFENSNGTIKHTIIDPKNIKLTFLLSFYITLLYYDLAPKRNIIPINENKLPNEYTKAKCPGLKVSIEVKKRAILPNYSIYPIILKITNAITLSL